ncbi:hypothetical protein [Kroppenstedtia sanguinis]|uniref:Uncharacterized protein n=1 Tax=Kroppenstedtia sanguinis TaxID=1380684 RepID=A0ABW4C693_9BACL
MAEKDYDYDHEKVSYDDLVEILSCGREIEFIFNETKYSITHISEGFSLCRYNTYETQDFRCYKELLEKARIDGRRLVEIWKDVRVEDIA